MSRDPGSVVTLRLICKSRDITVGSAGVLSRIAGSLLAQQCHVLHVQHVAP